MLPARNSLYISPLRYPGGKGQLANFIKLVVRENALSDADYVEVYAGGAGVALSLLLEEYVRCIHINDLDLSVFAFWHAVLGATDELCRRIRDTAVTMDEWHRQQAVHKNGSQHDLVDLAFSAFFLNRTNRSGVLKGGVIGGKSQAGSWKLDVRFNKGDLIQRIQRIARFAGRINLYNLDAKVFIETVLPSVPVASLVYFDPPYFRKGKDLYENHYTTEDHRAIAKLITQTVEQPWLVSYDLTPEIEEMYLGQPSLKYKLCYTAQVKYTGAEVMYHSRGLVLPTGYDPAYVSRAEVKRHSREQLQLAV